MIQLRVLLTLSTVSVFAACTGTIEADARYERDPVAAETARGRNDTTANDETADNEETMSDAGDANSLNREQTVDAGVHSASGDQASAEAKPEASSDSKDEAKAEAEPKQEDKPKAEVKEPNKPEAAKAPSPMPVQFPLTLSANGRYLVDQRQTPFLIKEISAWGLIQALSESEAAAFMDAVKAHGFNTLMVSAISWDQRFAGDPPRWNRQSPFLTEWDFSKPNETYFEHVDRVLELARSKDLLVLLVPAYLGYSGDPTQGWAARLLDANNSENKSRVYGRFLGQRYQHTPNIIWLAGGDSNADGALYPHMSNIILGIKEKAAQLWSAHWDTSMVWSTNNSAYAKWIDIDGLYAWTEASLGSDPQYKSELTRYARGKPMIQLDQSYERDVPHAQDNLDPQWIRRKNYDGLLSGCAGTSFSPGTDSNQLYTFHDWRSLMSTQGTNDARHTFALFESRPWYDLVPDTDGSIVVAGRGTYGDIDYACAARTKSGSSVLVYVPTTRCITVDMTKIAAASAKAYWYDPRTGAATPIGTYAASGKRSFSSPSGGDAVLVLDDASLKLPAPGATP